MEKEKMYKCLKKRTFHEWRFAYQDTGQQNYDVFYCVYCLEQENIETDFSPSIGIHGGINAITEPA
jgi:hypothetical protein|tara:strand:+ start:2039 stop:2236 length:198 start_codon:yes stop_codon:yes gene_type:complete